MIIEKRRILIADDNEVSRKVLQLILEKRQFDVVFAKDGFEALQLFAAIHFDLILMDYQMPLMSGAESSIKIRELESIAKIKRCPIVAISGSSELNNSQVINQFGMDAYIAKPFKTQELLTTIYRIIDGPNRIEPIATSLSKNISSDLKEWGIK